MEAQQVYPDKCSNCGRPLVLHFKPKRAKLCENCYTPRSAEELEAAEHDNRKQAAMGNRLPVLTPQEQRQYHL